MPPVEVQPRGAVLRGGAGAGELVAGAGGEEHLEVGCEGVLAAVAGPQAAGGGLRGGEGGGGAGGGGALALEGAILKGEQLIAFGSV